MISRRSFIRNTSISSLVLTSGSIPFKELFAPEISRLTILHTNDVHSRIEPFPEDGSRNAGAGGAVRRAALINKIRSEEKNVLLMDSGDIFQGTPYFNFFGGELEMKLMTSMGYDAATMGNHDFDAGIEGFEKQLIHADFPIVIGNYNFSNTVMNGKSKPYIIKEFDDLKIGITGVGIQLSGLVPQVLYKETQYMDPIIQAQKYAHVLKHDEKCDFVICLSHLGFKYESDKVSDMILAMDTEDIDLILGGHTHTFMRKPEVTRNLKGKKVIVNQAGWAGIMLGRLDITFERNKKGHCVTCSNTLIT
jgi:5'-nucleotidase